MKDEKQNCAWITVNVQASAYLTLIKKNRFNISVEFELDQKY